MGDGVQSKKVMEQIKLDWGQRRIRTVTQLTAEIRELLNGSFGDVWVAGEISQVKPAPSGHIYFTLKDGGAQIRCACFRSSVRFLRFKPQEGMAAVARGRVDVYDARGEYQLLVEALEPRGFGALQLAFEQLKKQLEQEGLFAAERKRPLPKHPRRIGIVTSPAGAVIRDMIEILTRRYPGIHIRLYPALVQGAGSVEAVVEGITYFSRSGWADVVIAGRGGGSLEDLWTFNEEAVARAIAACPVPVISAVGHETDFTIADMVADLRAPTPSAAAELAVPLRPDLEDRIAAAERRLGRGLAFTISAARTRVHRLGVDRATALVHRRLGRLGQRVDELAARLQRQDPRVRMAVNRRRLDAAEAALAKLAGGALAAAGRRVERLEAALGSLSPLRVLDRGYAIVQDPAGHVISSVESAADEVVIRLRDGKLGARVTGRLT